MTSEVFRNMLGHCFEYDWGMNNNVLKKLAHKRYKDCKSTMVVPTTAYSWTLGANNHPKYTIDIPTQEEQSLGTDDFHHRHWLHCTVLWRLGRRCGGVVTNEQDDGSDCCSDVKWCGVDSVGSVHSTMSRAGHYCHSLFLTASSLLQDPICTRQFGPK